jgi:putative endopeptidase
MTSSTHVPGAGGGSPFADSTDCVCCNNPWSRQASNKFALLCGVCEPIEVKTDQSLDPTNFDLSISPADNFFSYCNGGWQARNPIPPEYPNWNTFLELHTQNQERIKLLLDGDGKADTDESKDNLPLEGEAKMVSIYYNAALDEDAIEKAGHVIPLASLMDHCESAASSKDRARILGEFLSKFGLDFFFGVGASPDKKDSNHCIAQIGQSGLGLPDRDYYFDEDKAEKREEYKKHIANMLVLLDPATYKSDDDDDVATRVALTIYNIELQIAQSHMTKTESRDPLVTYNKMSMSELTELCGSVFDFATYFMSMGKDSIDDVGDINVRNIEAIKKIANVIMDLKDEDIVHYLKFHTVGTLASYLPKAFVLEDFHFYQTILSGTKELKPRWKRAMSYTENALGDALGKMYCEKYFDENCKSRAFAMVESVRAALEERLKEVTWMTADDTRKAALQKMSNFKIKIGYPDEWIDYSTMSIEEGEPFVSLVISSKKFDHKREMKEMNAPTNRIKWEMTPQTINAYYHPSLNEIVFPAAILQPPFFNMDADDAVNYGAIGAIVGHEMTHGFDDQGCKYDFEGNMKDWWTEKDKTEYEKRVRQESLRI